MSTVEEANKAVIRRYFEEVRTQGKLDVIDELFAREFTRLRPGGIKRPGQHEGLKGGVATWRTAFPDHRDTILSLVAEGDRVAAQVAFSGTHAGVLHFGQIGPWAPTGRRVEGWEFFHYRLAGGQIVEVAALWDPHDLLAQLGLGATFAPRDTP